MKGSDIIANGNCPNGRFIEGIISGTPAPGVAMEVVPGTEPVNGKYTYRIATAGSTGDRRAVTMLLEDNLQGVPADLNGGNTYTSGRQGRLYAPINGDEINVLVKNIAGTADSHAIGDQLMIDVGTGKFIVQDTAAHFAPFTLQETSAALTLDTLLCARFN